MVVNQLTEQKPEDQLEQQAERIIFASMFRAECHVAAGRFFGNAHLLLGFIAAGLAAGASATAFASQELVAGGLAIAAAAITAVITALRPDDRAQRHWNVANSFAELIDDVYMAFFFGPPSQNEDLAEEAAGADQQSLPKRRLLPQREERPATEDTDPSSEETLAISGPPHEQLKTFQKIYHRLDTSGPPLPERFTNKGAVTLAQHEGWYPPQYKGFLDWQAQVKNRKVGHLWWQQRGQGSP